MTLMEMKRTKKTSNLIIKNKVRKLINTERNFSFDDPTIFNNHIDRENAITADFVSLSSNIDVSFHLLTEKFDNNNRSSLLVNTLPTSSSCILELENYAKNEKQLESIQESDEEDSEESKLRNIRNSDVFEDMNPFDFQKLKKSIIKNQNRRLYGEEISK